MPRFPIAFCYFVLSLRLFSLSVLRSSGDFCHYCHVFDLSPRLYFIRSAMLRLISSYKTFKYHIFRKSTKLRRLVIGEYPTPTHGVILYLFAQPEFSPTAIKIKQPSSILRHPSVLLIFFFGFFLIFF